MRLVPRVADCTALDLQLATEDCAGEGWIAEKKNSQAEQVAEKIAKGDCLPGFTGVGRGRPLQSQKQQAESLCYESPQPIVESIRL
jgi:hypothetical protein